MSMPMIVNAMGIGIYTPLSLKENISGTTKLKNDYSSNEYDYNYKNDTAIGLGIAFDTNLKENILFNYRLGVEYLQPKPKHVSYNYNNHRIHFVNTFGFGVLHTENIKLWIGPRINTGFEFGRSNYDDGSKSTHVRYEFGFAPAFGINLNLDSVTLAADIDYRYAFNIGSSDNDSNDYTNTWSGTRKGATARIYIFLPFDEAF
jgi:hypothetical protein